jgi:hypothetical protein
MVVEATVTMARSLMQRLSIVIMMEEIQEILVIMMDMLAKIRL